ncbi:hypothetical protein EVAR_22631_1 [Eumeta japonica]|uniref:Uncharacterized protein n=1 Tax=Eumeta variegata TaxID=151549 RepID=A0A4C1VLP3_EUMVA|nr:hypothetical protein EVAR_22631_1 [Eumeta japonica]
MARRGGIWELRISTRVLLYGITGRNVRLASGNKEAGKDILDIIAESSEVRLFWVRAHAEPRETSVLTSSPEMPPLQRRRQRTVPLSFAKKAIKAASLEEWQEIRRG